jgi:lysophospholipase L1-like esterase
LIQARAIIIYMGYLVAKVGLAPVLLAQGLFVAKTIDRLPEAAGVRQGAEVNHLAKPLRLLVLGDSAAAGVGVATQNEALVGHLVYHLKAHFDLFWRVIAKTGATSASTLRHLHKIPDEQVDVVVLSLGVNDVTSGSSKKKFLEYQGAILQLLQTKFGARLIVVSGFPPVGKFPSLPQPLRWYLGMQSQRFDKGLAQLAQTQVSCEYLKQDAIDDPALMASDGFHPGPAIYQFWAREVAKRIILRQGNL